MSHSHHWAIAFAVVFLFCFTQKAQAGFITFDNENDFLSAAGPVLVESFESFSSIAGQSQVRSSLSTTNFEINHFGGSNFFVADEPLFGGFATDGIHYLEEVSTGSPNTFHFHSFQEPITAFGLFITDFGDFGNQSVPLEMTINDSTTLFIANPGDPDGSIRYFGVIATGGEIITDVKLTNADALALDEVSISAGVPEPSGILMFFFALVLGTVRFSRLRLG